MTLEEIKFWIEKCLCKPPFSGDFPATGKYNFPQLARTNYLPEEPVLPFNYLNPLRTEKIIGFTVSRRKNIFISCIIVLMITSNFWDRQKGWFLRTSACIAIIPKKFWLPTAVQIVWLIMLCNKRYRRQVCGRIVLGVVFWRLAAQFHSCDYYELSRTR